MSVLYKKLVNDENFGKVHDYIILNGFTFEPNHRDITFYAEESESNQIRGMGNLTQSLSFEIAPLIADNSFVAQVLLEKCLAIANSITDEVSVVVDKNNDKLLSALQKCGFEVYKSDVVILKRRF